MSIFGDRDRYDQENNNINNENERGSADRNLREVGQPSRPQFSSQIH
jgi:hypothetical protein